MYLVPFVPHALIESAKTASHHRRDQSSIITFRGVPMDNFGSNYAVSLPSAMDPSVVHQIQNSSNNNKINHVIIDLDYYHRLVYSQWVEGHIWIK